MAVSRSRLIFLLGFMGAGKSSVGVELARALHWPFVDLDTAIEAGQGLTIREIFEQAGESFFRSVERAALSELIKTEPSVIALGGGTFAQKPNVEMIRERGGATVWLDCSVEELRRRCAGITNRPLFRDQVSFELLFEQRLPFYQLADYRVLTEGRSPVEVADQIMRLLLFAV